METLRLTNEVHSISRVVEKANIAAADLATLAKIGVPYRKVIPQTMLVADAVIKISQRIDNTVQTIEAEALMLRQKTAASVLKGKRIEIRIVE